MLQCNAWRSYDWCRQTTGPCRDIITPARENSVVFDTGQLRGVAVNRRTPRITIGDSGDGTERA